MSVIIEGEKALFKKKKMTVTLVSSGIPQHKKMKNTRHP